MKWHQKKGLVMSLGFELLLEVIFAIIVLGVLAYFFTKVAMAILVLVIIIAIVAIFVGGG